MKGRVFDVLVALKLDGLDLSLGSFLYCESDVVKVWAYFFPLKLDLGVFKTVALVKGCEFFLAGFEFEIVKIAVLIEGDIFFQSTIHEMTVAFEKHLNARALLN